jgi:hypothetical protein
MELRRVCDTDSQSNSLHRGIRYLDAYSLPGNVLLNAFLAAILLGETFKCILNAQIHFFLCRESLK